MAKKTKKWRWQDYVFATVFSLIVVGLVAWIVLLIISGRVTTHNPNYNQLCKYSEWSSHDYKINRTSLDINQTSKGWLYFDSYKIENIDGGEIVTVKGYWYIDGFTWRKCDGELKFFTNEPFMPVENRLPIFEILQNDCERAK